MERYCIGFIKITDKTQLRKTDKGIFIDGELRIIKDFLLYFICFIEKCDKQKAARIYENNTTIYLLKSI